MRYLNIVKLKELSNKLVDRHNELSSFLEHNQYGDEEKVELKITLDRIFAKQDTINDIINCFEEK